MYFYVPQCIEIWQQQKNMLPTALSWPRGDLLFPTASSKAPQIACDRNQVEVEDPTSSKLGNGCKCFKVFNDTGFLFIEFIVCMWKFHKISAVQDTTKPTSVPLATYLLAVLAALKCRPPRAGHSLERSTAPRPAKIMGNLPRFQQREHTEWRDVDVQCMWKNKTKVSYGLKKLLYATTPWSKKPKNHPRSKWQAEFLAHLGVGPKFLHEPSSTHQVGFVHVGG